ncbi:MAG: hypothetical protein AAF368_00225 [Planctomycetota bacterium]
MKRAAGALLACALGGAGCASAPCPEGATAVTVNATPSASDFRAGQRVWIGFQRRWFAGTVARVLGPNLYEVSYEGYSDQWNTVARPQRLRAYENAPTSAAVGSPQPGRPVEDPSALQVGTPILILWNDRWWPGTVAGVAGEATDGVRVSYDGYGPEHDEVVPVQRITLPDVTAPD